MLSTKEGRKNGSEVESNVYLLHPAVSAKDRGVYMDATLSFDEPITSVTSSCLSSLSSSFLFDYDSFFSSSFVCSGGNS